MNWILDKYRQLETNPRPFWINFYVGATLTCLFFFAEELGAEDFTWPAFWFGLAGFIIFTIGYAHVGVLDEKYEEQMI